MELSRENRRLLAALEDGLPRDPRPYAALGARAGLSEAETLARLESLIDRGIVRRLGLIVDHRALGYTANAMVVWDLPDAEADAIGARLAGDPAVTLCYRRRRAAGWPYNLYVMIHGKSRETVEGHIGRIVEAQRLHAVPRAVLFSARRFKQTAARYGAAPQRGAA